MIKQLKTFTIQRKRESQRSPGLNRGRARQPGCQGTHCQCQHFNPIPEVKPVCLTQVEAAARRQAKQDFEAERRAMQEKMETEIAELQTHLK